MLPFQLMILLITAYIKQSYQEDNGFKWYEGDQFIDMSKRYTAPFVESVYRQLNESGVCRDQMGVNEKGEYMGMDLFMPFMGQYYDSIDGGVTSPDFTILTIHHLNTMLSYTYLDNRSPRPVFMGTFVATTVEIRQGRKEKMIVDEFTRRLNEICPVKEDKKYSEFITGYSIDGGGVDNNANRKMVFVCEDKVVTVPFLPNVTNRVFWGQPPASTNRGTECETNTELIYCDRGEEGRGKEKLMSIMALPKEPNDKEPYLIAYYSEDGGREVSTTSREYRIVVYDSRGMNPLEELNGKSGKKIDGHLAEIDVYRATEKGVEGMYFTIDGDACYFSKSYDELFEGGKGGKLTEIPDFENPEERKFTKRNCQSYLTYIGCPMGFCYENNFDASFTIKDKDTTIIYFTKNSMYWKLKDSKLPLDIPRIKDAMKPVPKKPLPPLWRRILGWFERLARELFEAPYSIFPCKDYFVNQGSAVCMTRSVGAAFAVPIDGKYKIFLHETIKNNWFISMAGNTSEVNKMKEDPFPGKKGTQFDAAWYNSKERRVYLFTGKQYTSYEHNENLKINENIEWVLKEEGQLIDFGINKDYLDAVVNTQDGNGYFFHDNFYWTVPEEGWKKSEGVPGNLSLLDFFAVRGECFANKEEDYERLISRYKEKNWTLADQKNAIDENRRETSKAPTKRSRLFILWFVLGGLLIVIIAYAAMYLYSKQDDKFVTKRKVEYIGSRTGKKTSPPKTSSRSSKKSTLSLNKTLSTPSSKVESKM